MSDESLILLLAYVGCSNICIAIIVVKICAISQKLIWRETLSFYLSIKKKNNNNNNNNFI